MSVDGKSKTFSPAVITALAGLAVMTVVCFLPLLRYYFAQDDFMLMYWSTHEAGAMMQRMFGPEPTHFRPLTKLAYFAVTFKVFALHPLPYHIISLLVHIGNALLVFAILRRLRLGSAAALMGTGVFALSVTHFHTIAWISCIQQVLAAFFFLSAIHLGLAALKERSPGKRVLSFVSYLLALLSVEQTFLTPLFLLLIAVFGLGDRRYRLRETVLAWWPHFLLLLGYAVMRLWKGVPADGTSQFYYGQNVWDNVVTYLGATYEFWPTISDGIKKSHFVLTYSHLILGGLVAYHLFRRRWGHVLFAAVFMAGTYLPTLFLLEHYFYYHTYVPALAGILLLGLILQDGIDLINWAGLRHQLIHLGLASALVLAFAVVSAKEVRRNERRAHSITQRDTASFVLRRALMAQNARDDLAKKAGDLSGVRVISLVLGSPGARERGGHHRDTFWALADGYAPRLFFAGTEAEVRMAYSAVGFKTWQTETSRVFFYDRMGHCYTFDEVIPPRNVSP